MKYAVVCCGGPLAIMNVRRSQAGSVIVQVETAAHAPHLQIVVNPVIDGTPTWLPDELSKHTHARSAERNVTEIAWDGHRSWIIRCGPDCPSNQQAQINAENLPKIAQKLSEGRWLEKIDDMPVVPLGVLSYLTDPRNW